MYVPNATDLMATVTPQVAAYVAPWLPVVFWLVGVVIAGIAGAFMLRIPQMIFGFFFDREYYKSDEGSEYRAAKRAGYRAYFDPVAQRRYWRLGSSRAWDKDDV